MSSKENMAKMNEAYAAHKILEKEIGAGAGGGVRKGSKAADVGSRPPPLPGKDEGGTGGKKRVADAAGVDLVEKGKTVRKQSKLKF
jgi:hypothetical protein